MIAWIRTALARVAAVVTKPRLDRDFDDELQTHLSLAIDEGLRRGLTPDEARRAALLRFGGVEPIKELHRDTRGLPLIETFLQDVRYAARTLRKTPAFTIVVVASLALGIGANTAVFTLINAALLRALPVPNPQELVRLTSGPPLSLALYRELRAVPTSQTVFTDIYGSSMEWPVRITLPTPTGSIAIDNAPTQFVTPSYFPVLGVQPQIGRFFTEDEDQKPDSAKTDGSVVVISDAFWARHFNRDPSVLGRIVHVNNAACRIVGVTPRWFVGERVATPLDAWVPVVAFSPRGYVEARDMMYTATVARLRPGVTSREAERTMTAIYQRVLEAQWRAYPETRRQRADPQAPWQVRPVTDFKLTLVPAATGLDAGGLRRTFAAPLVIVMAIVALVLLIACANVANLLLARSAWRQREFSLRLALGCSRGRLVRQLLTESVLLATVGATVGLLLAVWGTRSFALLAKPGSLDVTPDLRVLGFLASITILTGLAFGIAPALRAGRVDLTSSLNEQGRGGAGGSGSRMRQRMSRSLVMTQVALSLVLLIGSGLLIRTLYNLRQVDLGFRPEQVVMFDIAKQQGLARPALATISRELRDRVREIPGVHTASVSRLLLFGGSDLYLGLRFDDYAPSLEEPTNAHFNFVTPGYFETLGMTLLQGRTLQDSDTADQPPVAVINRALARKYFPTMDPIDRMVSLGRPGAPRNPIRIVGVVADAKYNDLRSEVVPMIYFSADQHPGPVRGIEVRTSESVAVVSEAVRQVLMQRAPELMIQRVATLSDQVERTLAAERIIATLGVAFGGIALLLASIGLYGVLSYGVARRTGEIGIRIALGATRARVLWLILRQSFGVVLGGIAAGLVVALLATRLIARFLYGLTPTDTATIAVATTVLLCVATLAAWLPARRATRVDPMIALRRE